ncbi:Arginine/lysine/ornithine decarboxylase [Paenibacillaceae bacterium GAS479]|nr:Arginine/lysine/ornithine decarboxylase [Paenibacillaceae bacterium GAS479]
MKMKIGTMPIVEMLHRHAEKNPLSFHVPGHKGKIPLNTVGEMSAEEKLSRSQSDYSWSLFEAIFPIDVTELSDTDDLHDAGGAIAEAQQLAASLFGAEETAFLVGGSTAGNLSLVLGCCERGELILVQRNVHKSVLNGLKLAGASVVFLDTEHDPASGLPDLPTIGTVEKALNRWPHAKAVFLSNPSYYGWSRNLQPYAELVHRSDRLLLVDEAHGAHYGLNPRFPSSALQAGADAVVQSTHKTLPAMTMAAMLHMQGDRLNRDRVKGMLAALQSSSPSYPLMASLDMARGMLSHYGAEWFERGLHAADTIRDWLREQSSRYGLAEDLLQNEWIRTDPLRIVFYDREGLATGVELQKQLERRGCWAEMADDRYVVLLVGAQCSNGEAERLLEALVDMEKQDNGSASSPIVGIKMVDDAQRNRAIEGDGSDIKRITHEPAEPIVLERFPMEPHRLEQIPLLQAVGRKSGETIVPYPPGIPILMEGETIRQETVELMIRLQASGVRFQGMKPSEKGLIRVMCN